MTGAEARATAERVARVSYGRLVALLAAPTGDLALAEDSLASAFEQALTTWPQRGVPTNPEGWLLTVARNRQRDAWKSAAHRTSTPLEAATDQGRDAVAALDVDPDAIGDDRLALLFVCAHPAIEESVRTPLMLQVVLGFDAARIATAFAVPATTTSQRLVRAKKRIKDTRIRFAVPDRHAMPERLPPVLEAVYACYALTWSASEPTGKDLAGEAQYLAVTLAALLEDEPEAWSLAALITLALARAPARGEAFVPLEDQDPAGWDAALIDEGESYLRRATGTGAPGRFQLEAAIQAVHGDRRRTGRTDWAALRDLYTALVTLAPSLGAHVARAAVVGRVDGPDAGLAALAAIATDEREAAALERFQPFHATRAELLAQAGRRREAAAVFDVAASLTDDPRAATYLRGMSAAQR